MATIFNDNDAGACAWLRELVAAGYLQGDVLEKDIRQVDAADLVGRRRVHFFAGIGGWELALRLAGWPDDGRTVWTGSCPCQPFSAAGRGKGEADERHLWPAWFSLIRKHGPDCLFGEQVASRDGYRWLDGVRTDLESEGYAFGAADLPAACVGAPHVRQRLFWCARRLPDADGAGLGQLRRTVSAQTQDATAERGGVLGDAPNARGAAGQRDSRGVSGAEAPGRRERIADGHCVDGSEHGVATGDLPDARHRQRRRTGKQRPDGNGTAVGEQEANQPERRGAVRTRDARDAHGDGRQARDARDAGEVEGSQARQAEGAELRGGGGYWDAFDVVHYRDGKARRVEPGTFPLAHGVPARVVKLRGYGNAIVPQVAALFIRAFLESE